MSALRWPPTVWLAAAVGLAVRLWYAGTSGLYLDEAQVLGISSLPRAVDIFQVLAAHESHPPLYYLVVRWWQDLVGRSAESSVALSILAGTLAIALGYQASLRLSGSRRTAMATAWLIALSPTLVRYSVMVRPYILLTLLVLGAVWSLTVAVDSGSKCGWIVYSITAVLLVYTHYWAWLVLAGLNTAVLIERGTSGFRTRIAQLAPANLVVVVAFLPWFPSFLNQMRVAGHHWPKGFLKTLAESLWVLSGTPTVQTIMLAAALLILWYLGGRDAPGRNPRLERVVWTCLGTIAITLGLAIVLSPITLLLVSQCFALLTPLWVLGTATVMDHGGVRPRLHIMMLLVILLAYIGQLFVTSRWVRSDMREIGAFLRERVRADDVVLIFPDYPAPTLRLYFHPPGQVLTYPTDGLPAFVPFDQRLARDADTSGFRATRRFVEEASAQKRLWYVTIPMKYPPIRSAVESILLAAYGEPACVYVGSERPRLYEDMLVTLYSRSPTDAGSCR